MIPLEVIDLLRLKAVAASTQKKRRLHRSPECGHVDRPKNANSSTSGTVSNAEAQADVGDAENCSAPTSTPDETRV